METLRPDLWEEDSQFGGKFACALFIPAVTIFSLGMYYLLSNLGSGGLWHAAFPAPCISRGIAALELGIGFGSLNKRVDRSMWAILGIALNSPLVVAGLCFGIMAVRTLWPGGM